MKSHLCMPRFKGGSRKNSRRLSPMTLLDRFREAVFRLIMLSALSKANTHNGETRRSPNNNSNSSSNNGQYRCYNPNDPHHSEAVADCIEFIKKSSTTDENRDSTASSSSDGASQVGFRVPVM